jgi:lipoprotein-anchoring transpeptidase ErfK/SrfK
MKKTAWLDVREQFLSGWSNFSAGLVLVALAGLMTGCSTTGWGPGAPSTAQRDDTVRLQIYLDARNFGPGVIDGRDGEFTRKALGIYESVMKRRPDASQVEPYTTFTLTSEDMTRIGPLGSTPEEMARQKRLPYTSAAELVAERFRTTEAFLAELNPTISMQTLQAGDSLRVPNVSRPLRVDRFPSAYPRAPGSTSASRRVDINTSERILRVIEGDRLVAAFPISPGSDEHPAPPGDWKIVRLAPWPWFRWDEGVLKRGERTETYFQLPPGENSPVGILWAGLDRPGIGIHGSPTPETIGRSGSHGCIRLSNWDAATFYTLVASNTPVSIR